MSARLPTASVVRVDTPDASAVLTRGIFILDPGGSGDFVPAASGTPAAVLVDAGDGFYDLTPIGSASPTAPRGELLRLSADGDFLVH